MTNPRNRIPLAEAERIIGRACTHERRGRDDYCRACSNMVAQRRQKERDLLVSADGALKGRA